MYCEKCGNEIKAGLNFCSRCGARVSSQSGSEIARRSPTEGLSNALGAIGVFGFIGYIFVALVLLQNNAHNALVAVSFFYFASLFGICLMILNNLKALAASSRSQSADFQNDLQTGELKGANTAQLEEPKQQPIPVSVTENTTRTLDRVESKL